jgi:rare lipoprotein A
MKAMLVSLALTVGALLTTAVPASAQNWWDSVIKDMKSQSGEVSQSSSRRSARAATSRSSRATRVASSDNDDDGSRPQRRGSSRPNFRSSVSSGGETGVASYYWQPQAVASGGRFNPDAWTAAHKTLPFGTRVRVTRLDNGNSVEVTINDRGPYISGRIIDLSRRAAQAIGMTGQGVARVSVAVLGRG